MLGGLIRKNRQIFNAQIFRNITNQKEFPISKKPTNWDLYAGVLIERLPVVSKSLNAIEQEFQTLLWQQEFEGSLKSNHEVKFERDILQAKLIEKGELEIDLDESSSKQTAQDLKDAYVEEYKQFNFAHRITEADKKNDIKSADRALDDTLYLIIEQKIGDKLLNSIPQGERIEGENMRQTAERILKEKCGESLQVMFYGNAPCAFFKFKYPSNLKKQARGAKIFLYRTSLKQGNVDSETTKSFEWQTKEELLKKIEGTHMENLQKILV